MKVGDGGGMEGGEMGGWEVGGWLGGPAERDRRKPPPVSVCRVIEILNKNPLSKPSERENTIPKRLVHTFLSISQ